MKTEHFFYDFEGCKQTGCNDDTVLISTVRLPNFSKKYEGKCAGRGYYKFPARARIGTRFNIAFGDPRIMMGCKLISTGAKNVPKDIRELIIDCTTTNPKHLLGFEYAGGTFYVDWAWMCRLEDLC